MFGVTLPIGNWTLYAGSVVRGYGWSVWCKSCSQVITKPPPSIAIVWFAFATHPLSAGEIKVCGYCSDDGFGLTLTLNVLIVLFVIVNHLPL